MKLVIMTKGKKLAEGTIRTHGGKKVQKKAGKWVPYSEGKKKEFSGTTGDGKKVRVGQEPNGMYYAEIRDRSGSVESSTTKKTHSEAMKWFDEHGVKKIDWDDAKKEKLGGVLSKKDSGYDAKRDPVINVKDALDDPSQGPQFVTFLEKKGYTKRQIANLDEDRVTTFADEFEKGATKKKEDPWSFKLKSFDSEDDLLDYVKDDQPSLWNAAKERSMEYLDYTEEDMNEERPEDETNRETEAFLLDLAKRQGVKIG